ncbi:threonyl-tRNA synthetase [Streptococcus pneumoniae]|nr:threonyl-tRNA synthetase [Streptococcus pneumoniae SP6-BS73]CGF61049.1 threonyl-tRNA synthetase [Streptococcus pneumoniae]VQD78091.1 threonyl-tRNA synthetase [Streptococcus pneumoniae]
MEDETVNVRRYGQKETQTVSVDNFVQAILADIANKSRVEK